MRVESVSRSRSASLFGSLVLALGAASCVTMHAPQPEPLPLVTPQPIRIPTGSFGGAPHTRAMDLQAGGEELASATASIAMATSTSALALLPNEAIDLDMEAERATEEDVLDEMEAGAPKKIRSILAVTGTVTFDIPMSEDELIEQWTQYFMGRGRKWYEIWLSRSTRYVPIFQEILHKHGLPNDLIFLAMIESGFSPNAYSWAHAAGPWQFIPWTGKRYGLEIDFWLDERRDFVLATEAAARYLKKLHDQFGDWYLAWAAYNAGEGRVSRAIKSSGIKDWWKLSRTRHLRRETKHYVPKLLAAAIVSKQPQRFGFENIEYLAPFEWDVLTVTTSIDLATLARACGDPAFEEELKTLNPALRRYVSPPGRSYNLRVPKGRQASCVDGVRAIPANERVTYRYHHVQRGDTPASIAKKYHTTIDAILTFNNVDAKKLALFGELVVPIPASVDAEVPVIKPPDQFLRPTAYVPEGANVILHRVESGDSLWKIANKYRVSLKKLKLWNGIWRNSALRVGQVIRIYTLKARAT